MFKYKSGFFVLDHSINKVEELATMCSTADMELSDFRPVHHGIKFQACSNERTKSMPFVRVDQFCDLIKELVIDSKEVQDVILTGNKEAPAGFSAAMGYGVIAEIDAKNLPLNIKAALAPNDDDGEKVLELDLSANPTWFHKGMAGIHTEYMISGHSLILHIGRLHNEEPLPNAVGITSSAVRVFSDGTQSAKPFSHIKCYGYFDHNFEMPMIEMDIPWDSRWMPKYIVDQERGGAVFRVGPLEWSDNGSVLVVKCARVGWIPSFSGMLTNVVASCELIDFPTSEKKRARIEFPASFERGE